MFEELDFIRSPSIGSIGNGWLGLAIFTIILAIFVLPSETPSISKVVIGIQTGT